MTKHDCIALLWGCFETMTKIRQVLRQWALLPAAGVVLLGVLVGGASTLARADEEAKIAPGERDADGFLVHRVESAYQSELTKIKVLLPGRIEPERRYRVLYVLPVEPQENAKYGSSAVEIKKLDVADKYDLICVLPTFAQWPWYADHPTDPKVRQESYFLKVVLPWIDRTYPTQASRKGRLLLGFSKSGWGAFSLLLRHPDVFDKAVAWDAPLMMDRPKFGMDEVVATQAVFESHRISTLLHQNAARLAGQSRLAHFGYGNFREDHQAAHRLMEELGIDHVYRDGPSRKHDWSSGWLPEAVEMLVGPAK